VLVVLDNLEHQSLGPLWHRIATLASDGDFGGARRLIDELRKVGSAEAQWLSELATRALGIGCIERVDVFGLSKPDVIFYLDPPQFGLAEGWSSLHHQWRREPRGEVGDFKSWLRKEKAASISTQRVRRAAEALEVQPSDLVQLVARIRELGLAPIELP